MADKRIGIDALVGLHLLSPIGMRAGNHVTPATLLTAGQDICAPATSISPMPSGRQLRLLHICVRDSGHRPIAF
jgi:hypothetical protein